MKYKKGQIYHVFNQGNNRQVIFYENENYLYFLRKVRQYILPYADILCYCLMPNHFHFLIIPNQLASSPSNSVKPRLKLEQLKGHDLDKQEKLSQNIGILLSSYTKAVNKKYQRSGSLFRGRTKVKDGWVDDTLTVKNVNSPLFFRPENDYGCQCFHYIHQNPVKAKLVKKETDWIYSSAKDYAGLRNGTLCNQDLAKRIFFW